MVEGDNREERPTEEDLGIERKAKPTAEDMLCEQIEIAFALPCYITQEQQHALWKIAREIVESPVNQASGFVHWLSTTGCKTNWSKVDAALLGKKADANAPDAGEPTYDESIFVLESSFRAAHEGET